MAGIFGDRLIGPFFYLHNLIGEMDLKLLEEALHPVLIDIIQQDAAPPHYALIVHQYLDHGTALEHEAVFNGLHGHQITPLIGFL